MWAGRKIRRVVTHRRDPTRFILLSFAAMPLPRLHLALIGRSIAHSLSPALQAELARRAGLDASFELIDVDGAGLADAAGRVRSGELTGANVTSPHKEAVVELVDELTVEARRIGAVNVLFVRGGRLVGDNTDIVGVRATIDASVLRPGTTVTILGTGGAARAAAIAALGYPGVDTIEFRSRDVDAGRRRLSDFADGRYTVVSTEAPYACGLLINATPAGGMNQTRSPLEGVDLAHVRFLFDMNYLPLETPLMQDAMHSGVPSVGGLAMFVAQGVAAFNRWTGIDCSAVGLEEMLRQLVEQSKERIA